MTMTLGHYYHLFCNGGEETPIVAEHLQALADAGLGGTEMRLGVVGPPEARRAAIDQCAEAMDVTVLAEAETGWEQVTLDRMQLTLLEDAVLYAHTKRKDYWRRKMTEYVVSRWRSNLGLLDGRCEAVGCWVRDGLHPAAATPTHFSGNFWMARSDLIHRLPPPSHADRWQAEFWLGTADPPVRVQELLPEWPDKWST